MTHTYKITGMTCNKCEANVKSSLLKLPNVTNVEVSREKQSAIISMDKHISLSNLQNALESNYSISARDHSEPVEQAKSWLATYKPILLIFAYISILSFLFAVKNGNIDWLHAMNIFMAGFFLTFSFFKMVDLRGFAESYSMYDIVAKRWKAWGYIYAFLELGLGIAFATNFNPLVTNLLTFLIMTISIIGVLQSVFSKRKIRCACLGAIFNLPMSTITILEDALMIAMSGIMLITML